MRAALTLAILLLASGLVAAQADGERIASGVAAPVALAFAHDGALLYAELNAGQVRRLADEGASPSEVARVPSSPGGNGGFTGLAVDPADSRVLYVVYSFEKDGAPNGKVNRVSKLVDGAETVLLDDIPWAEFHDGGRVAVGPDGLLYVTTGDNGDYRRQPGNYPGDPAQDPQSLKGKILRLGKDGSAAGGVAGWNPYVYALGFRNPFGLAFGPDGRLYAADNGINHDEVNVVVQGGNYGWPACDGDCSGYQRPLTTFPDSFGTTGLAYAGGKLYLGDYNNARLRVVDPATGATQVGWSAGGDEGVLDVAAGPDGCVYASTFSAIHQVDVAGGGACDLRVVTPPTPTPTTSTPPTTTPTPTTTTPSPTPTSPEPTPPPTSTTPEPTPTTPSPSPEPTPTTPGPTATTPASPVGTTTLVAPTPDLSPSPTAPQESVATTPEVNESTPPPSGAGGMGALVVAALGAALVIAALVLLRGRR